MPRSLIVFTDVPKFLEKKYGIIVSYHTLRYWLKKFSDFLPQGTQVKPYTYRFYTQDDIRKLATRLKILYNRGEIHLRVRL